MFNLVEFSHRLRAERRAMRLNQADFGGLGGVGLQTQSRYEKAETEPQVGYLANLAVANVDVLYLLTGERRIESRGSAGDEAELLASYRQLTEDMQAALLLLAQRPGPGAARADREERPSLHERRP